MPHYEVEYLTREKAIVAAANEDEAANKVLSMMCDYLKIPLSEYNYYDAKYIEGSSKDEIVNIKELPETALQILQEKIRKAREEKFWAKEEN